MTIGASRDDTTAELGQETEGDGGADRSLNLIVVCGDLMGSYALPRRGDVEIGRSNAADVPIDDASVSRQHARLTIDEEIFVTDLGSSNGTKISGTAIPSHAPRAIRPGDLIELGAATLVIQKANLAKRRRRICGHDYFELRVEEECLRAEAGDRRFAVARVGVELNADNMAVTNVLARAMRSQDLLGSYAPGQFELLLLDTEPPLADAILRSIETELEGRGVATQCGLACYPRDGRDPDALLARAGDSLKMRADGDDPEAVVVTNPAMRQLHDLVARVAKSEINVLLLGETGVGKEIIAQELHRRSRRADGPLVRLNCGAVPEALLESELFGHVRGAFTGANKDKVGLLETANGGTFFLDEIGEMPLAIQVKLLRTLENRRFTRLGDVTERTVDVRFVAATNRDLEREVRAQRFRSDLFYRLNGISITIPPLRDRCDEIGELVTVFIRRASRDNRRRQPLALTPAALQQLERYSWPGNIRELRNVIERAVVLCTGDTIDTEHLPQEKVMSGFVDSPGPSTFEIATIQGAAADLQEDQGVERQRIVDALEECAGNQSHAAKMLGVSRSTLVRRLDQYGISRPRKRR